MVLFQCYNGFGEVERLHQSGKARIRVIIPTVFRPIFQVGPDAEGAIVGSRIIQTWVFSDVDMLTVWLPLTDARKDMGCLQVVPGSHKGGCHCTVAAATAAE